MHLDLGSESLFQLPCEHPHLGVEDPDVPWEAIREDGWKTHICFSNRVWGWLCKKKGPGKWPCSSHVTPVLHAS